jgi:FlaA1/EpsC-like NDP-sugar epimerase
VKALLGNRSAIRVLRHVAVITLDGAAVAASLGISVFLRMNGNIPEHMASGMLFAVPVFILVSLAIFHMIGLYRRAWRYVSVGDLAFVIEAATLAIIGSLLLLMLVNRVSWIPGSVPIIQWFVLIVLLGGLRLTRRMARELLNEFAGGKFAGGKAAPSGRPAGSNAKRRPALVIGSTDRVEIMLRMLEVDREAGYKAVGILDNDGRDFRLRLRGVPVLGSVDALQHVVDQLEARGQRPECVILADHAGEPGGPAMLRLVTEAESLGLTVARQTKPAELDSDKLHLQPVDMADLLGRPQANHDLDAVARAVSGRRVLVTGAGGTIGRELVRQIAGFGPSELVLLDAGEFNLYSVDMEIRETFPELNRVPVLCSIRQRASVMQTFARHRPELVFHAAALKHVPLVEENPCAGVQTNVLGTRNVADAARRYNVRAMVQVSTDKAVNPVGIMGATKRLGELYCQALDLAGQNRPDAPRFMTVRFGNVLGSSGSLIPLFQRQLSHRKPLTVTHPEIERFFMTVHEAVQLILQSTARALEGGVRRGRIFVLDMGEPIKIIDIARRMIRLAGLEPEKDVKINIVGLRPGEKLYEELFDEKEERLPSVLPGIFEAEPSPVSLEQLDSLFDLLATASGEGDAAAVRSIITAQLNGTQVPDAEMFHFVRSPASPSGAISHAA